MNDPQAPPMNSRQKVDAHIARAKTAQPENEQQAMMAQLLTLAEPMVGTMVPEDPAELDEQLLSLGQWALSMRSDDAPVEAVVVVRERQAAAAGAGEVEP